MLLTPRPLPLYVDALQSQLDGMGDHRGPIAVVLSDAWCRYVTTPRPSGIRNHQELQAALHGRFEAVYADEPGEWTLAHHAHPTAHTDLVVGARTALLGKIQSSAQAKGVKVLSIKPHWVHWHDHWHKALSRGQHWLISADSQWAGIGYVDDGHCLFARAVRLQVGAQASTLDELLARHQALVSQAHGDAHIWVGGNGLDLGELPKRLGSRFHADQQPAWSV